MNKISLKVDTVNAVLSALGKEPYIKVYSLIKMIQDDIEQQKKEVADESQD